MKRDPMSLNIYHHLELVLEYKTLVAFPEEPIVMDWFFSLDLIVLDG
jgi:hypothetical protein